MYLQAEEHHFFWGRSQSRRRVVSDSLLVRDCETTLDVIETVRQRLPDFRAVDTNIAAARYVVRLPHASCHSSWMHGCPVPLIPTVLPHLSA
jgi:hypothetical protein